MEDSAEAASRRSREQFGVIGAGPSLTPPSAAVSDSPTMPSGACPEIDCVRHLLSPEVIDRAEARAERVDVGADRALIASGALSEETYLRTFAESLGTVFEPLDDVSRENCPLDDERLLESAAAGILPLSIDGDLAVVVAPRGGATRRIQRLIEENPARANRFRFTSAERLINFVLRHGGNALTARAADDLKRKWPAYSAAPPRWRGNLVPVAVILLAILAAALAAPSSTLLFSEVTLAAVFLAWLGLRLVGAFVDWLTSARPVDLPDAELPVYTVIAALYREAASVDGLLGAIERLDYPAEKLDVIVALEADDTETRAAIEARGSRLPITIIPVAAAGPRTKPKALNFVLPFARGTFTVIYDAEDRPEPDQLRRALQAFGKGGDKLICVQARLCIDNGADGWITRFFTAEYAGQFDVFLPGLDALRSPLPLGGSSNHFYTAALREIGAWDPYNVTEDADLGMRLARFGYRAGLIDSTTYEEAPAQFAPWLRQRTRWFKGWMQTWLVHMRSPGRLLRDLGFIGFVSFQLIVGGNALAALVHPLFMAALIFSIARGVPMWRSDGAAVIVLAAVYSVTAIAGYLTSALLGWIGLMRRGMQGMAWVLLLTPIHWLMLSLAAWRALYQLVVAPYAWEKTDHGLAKTSLREQGVTRSLVELERHLSALKDAGELPTLVPEQPENKAAAPSASATA